MTYVKNKNGFEIGDWATTIKKVDSCAGYFEKGTKVIVPMILKIRCISAAVFAFFFAPTLDRIAVTQVPIFCPMII